LQLPSVNNVLQVAPDSTATLTLTTAVYATNLYVLNLGGGNSGTFTVTVTFADTTTQVFTNVNLNDWCSGLSPATARLYRIPQTAINCSTADTCTYMYETALAISALNQNKKITSITFTNTTTTQTPNPILNVFAVGGTVLTACATPQHQPTALALTPGYTSVAGTFVAATGTPSADHYLIVRSTTATLGANPVNGTTYVLGSIIGNGVVVSYQTTTSFADTALLKLTQYYYFLFSSNANCALGPVYFTTTPLSGNVTTNGQSSYTASGTWVCPAGVTSVTVQCWGGGGGGGSRSVNGGAGGGGGGAFASGTIAVVPGTTYPVTVGTGGASTVAGIRSAFKTATDSIIAAGGKGGVANDSVGATGGLISACRGTIIFAGGNGGNGVYGSNSGGGGGGAGTTGAGGNASGITAGTGTATSGGNGGAGRTTQGTGTAGTANGGGGSGGYRTSSNTRAGGAGARGSVTIIIPLPPCVIPANQPTGLNLTASYNSISGTFTASAGTPSADHYLILRSTLSTFTATPVDGATYTIGSTTAFIGGTVVSYQSSTTFNDTALVGNTQYYYYIFAANSSCTGGPIYFKTLPLTGNATTTCAIPLAQPTVLVLTPGLTSIDGSFTASANADNYLIVRSTSATLTTTPVDGTNYTPGSIIGGGTFIAYQTGTTFTDINLTPATKYYYFIFAANSIGCYGGPTYLIATPLTGNAFTSCNTPLNQPTSISLTPYTTTVAAFFTASTGTSGADHYLVVRSLNATLTATPVNDTVYVAGESLGGGTVVAYQTGTAFTDNGPLTPGTQYYYFVFATNSLNCSNGPAYLTTLPLIGNTTTNCIPPAFQPTALVLVPANTTVTGSFTASTGTPAADHYLIIRSTLASLTASPVNGITYTTGTALGGGTIVAYQTTTTFTDNGLNSGTLYYYFVFAVNTSCLSQTTYLTTLPLTNSTTTTLPCTTPLNQPTTLVLTPGNTTVTGSFTASVGTPAADHYLIVRSTLATLSASPVSGTIYTTGTSLGGGTIIAYQTTTTFTDNGLISATLYHYFVFAFNVNCSGGPLYLTTSPLTNFTTTLTPCVNPANQPTGLTLTPGSTSVSGSFTASTGTPTADHYLIIRNTSSTLSVLPVTGTTYTTGTAIGSAYVISYQTTTSFVDNLSISPGTLYYYFIFAANSSNCTGGPNYLTSTPLTGSTTTIATVHDIYVTSIITPTGTVAANTTQTVSMRFKNEGTVSESTIPLTYQVNALNPVLATWTGTLAPGDSVLYTFTTTFTSPNTGTSFTLCASSKLTTDIDTANDRICKTIGLTGVGINENSAVNTIKISPNPVRDKLNINCGNIKKGVTNFTIYNVQGAKLYNEETIITIDNYNKVINVNNLNPGIYFLKIENETGNTTNKFIIE